MKREPESLLLADDAEAYRRFIEWSVGDGFDLAIIKMTAPVDRNALIAWTKEQVPGAREIDLKTIGPGGARLWDLLLAARDRDQATMLLLYGLEESPSRPLILAQLNVERDELVKALALPWVLFVHPATYPALVDKAPDFVDFAGLWLDGIARVGEAVVGASVVSSSSDIALHNEAEPVGEGNLLVEAARAIMYSQLDKARDLLSRFELRQASSFVEDLDALLVQCLRAFIDNRIDDALHLLRQKLLPNFERLSSEAIQTMIYVVDILRFRGEWNEAWHLAQRYLLPAHERLGDMRSRALTLGKVADILAIRGDLDEALRIRREEQLPVYERLADVRERAATLGRIADILVARGELEEALRIYLEEQLPAFERLGDARARVVTRGRVADVLMRQGELDEALRIYREEELPMYESLGEVRSRAMTLGRIADILDLRGEVDEALRIRRDEQLPLYERLGDIRSRAVTLGKIAEFLANHGELDEALRIRRDEQLPVYERVGDVRAMALTLGQIAGIRRARGELDEALRIRREEELPVYQRLGDVRALLAARVNIALLLSRRGQPEDRQEIENLLALALQDARRLRIPEAQTIENIIRRMGRDPTAPPFA